MFRVAVVGMGAVGTVLTRRLEAGGAQVCRVTRLGVSDESVVDAVVVAVKSYDTDGALASVAAVVGDETLVLTVQNGLGNVEAIERRFGKQRAVAGSTTYAAKRLDCVVYETAPGWLALAAVDPEQIDAVEILADRFTAHGLPTTCHRDARQLTWSKLGVASAILPLTALTGLDNGELLDRADLRELIGVLAAETEAVAGACGVEVGGLAERIAEVAKATGRNVSSMRQDVEAGRRTEIDQLNGAICRLACEVGVAVPAHGVLTALVASRRIVPELSGVRATLVGRSL